MAESYLILSQKGQELRQQDTNALAKLAGLGPDYVLAELFRMRPFDGTTVAKGVLPYSARGLTGATVSPTLSANGSVLVNPFRAFVGSRTSVGADAVANWRDIRTALFTGNGSLSSAQAFAGNSSGNPRWDVVYAAIGVDSSTGSILARIKDFVAQSVSSTTLNNMVSQVITIAVAPGTPGATPTVPSVPADGGGVFNIALAAVRIPNGFGSLSTVAAQDIRDLAPVVSIASITGAGACRPANGNNDGAGTYATNFPWVAGTAASRPSVWLPPSMIGDHTIMVAFDVTNAAAPSFTNGAIVDNSMDWRNRFFTVFATGGPVGTPFAMDPASPGTVQRVPSWNNGVNTTAKDWQQANSFYADGNLVSGKSTVYYGIPATLSALGGGSTLGLYVEPSDGTLRASFTGTPAARVWFTIIASAQQPNN